MPEPERPSSAMGPDEEPGEANPPKADESLGLGGPGTEGKPGNPEGGVEPQIPEDIPIPDENDVERIVENLEKMPPAKGSPADEKKRRTA